MRHCPLRTSADLRKNPRKSFPCATEPGAATAQQRESLVNKRNRPQKKQSVQRNPAWLKADHRKLSRDAEKHVVRYMRLRRWINTTRPNLSTAGNRLTLLKHLPEIFNAVPDAFWSPSVYKTLLRALLMIQYPYLRLEPPEGRVTGLIVLTGEPLRIPKRLRHFVQDTPEVENAAPALQAVSNWLKAPPIQRNEYSDLEQLMKIRTGTTARTLGLVADDVAVLLEYAGEFTLARNGWTTRANALFRTIRASRPRS